MIEVCVTGHSEVKHKLHSGSANFDVYTVSSCNLVLSSFKCQGRYVSVYLWLVLPTLIELPESQPYRTPKGELSESHETYESLDSCHFSAKVSHNSGQSIFPSSWKVSIYENGFPTFILTICGA